MGRQLVTFGNNTYTYNEDGIRISKTVDNVTTTYYLDETNIIEQITGNTVLHFYYDSNDEIIGFEYTDDNYYYVKNAMSDIVGIVDSSGNLIVRYTYDPWGKVLSVTGSNTEIGNLNPFRYRSYYYDVETGFYYLQSRYYDPEVGRFINCDDVNYIGATGSEVSYNPFAYCENNTINKCDPSGSFGTPIQWVCAIIGAIVGIPFGKWIANKLGYYSGWRYNAIRAAAVVGGAALGWFAGTKIIKLVKLYVQKNPFIFIRIASRYGINALNTFRYVFGLGNVYITKILLGSGLVSRFVAHLIVTADRVASGLKSDLYHRAASYLSESQLAKGKVYIINNGKKILLQVYGYLNGKRGVFEYIIDESGKVCHQLFKEGRYINGIPN